MPKTLKGVVVSDKMAKTVVVRVETYTQTSALRQIHEKEQAL